MAQYRGVGNVTREIVKAYRGVGNVAREIVKAYRGVGNVARIYFQKISWQFQFAESNLGDDTEAYFHGFEEGVLKLYLHTNLSARMEENRPTVTARLSNGRNLGGKALKFSFKRYPKAHENIWCDSLLWFLGSDGLAMEWDTTAVGNDFGVEYGSDKYAYLLDEEYTTRTITIPDGAMHICFSMHNGERGAYEQTAWINHLSVNGEKII